MPFQQVRGPGPGPVKTVLLSGSLPVLKVQIPDPDMKLREGLWEFQIRSVTVQLDEPKELFCSISCSWLHDYHRNSNLNVGMRDSPLQTFVLSSRKSMQQVACNRIWLEANQFTTSMVVTLSYAEKPEVPLTEEGNATALLFYRRKK